MKNNKTREDKKYKIINTIILIVVLIIIALFIIVSTVKSMKPNETYDTSELISCYNELSDNIGKMTYKDCAEYFNKKGMKHQVERNGDIISINVYDNNNCYLKVITWPKPYNLILVGYIQNEDKYKIYSLSTDAFPARNSNDKIEYCISENSKESYVKSKQEQTDWFFSKINQ